MHFYQNLVLKEIFYPRQLPYSGISVCPVFCLLYLLVLPLGSRCNLSGNVSQSTGISGYPWSFFRCKSRSCFCNFKRSFQLDDSAFCFCRWCGRSSRILSYQPKIRTFPDPQSCSDRNYDHVTLQCRCHNDQICRRPQ